MLRVHIRNLIHFYDCDERARPHANAIKTVAGEELNLALLVRYFGDNGATAEVLKSRCTQGTKNGKRLDAWVRVSSDTTTFYQVEAKAWSFHGYGGGPALPLHHDPALATRVRREWWGRYWNSSTGRFRNDELNKVLLPMKRPLGADNVEALACLWTSMHPKGDAEPLFYIPVVGAAFGRVAIFSVSTYLRRLAEHSDAIDLSLKDTESRINHLSSLFTNVAAS